MKRSQGDHGLGIERRKPRVRQFSAAADRRRRDTRALPHRRQSRSRLPAVQLRGSHDQAEHQRGRRRGHPARAVPVRQHHQHGGYERLDRHAERPAVAHPGLPGRGGSRGRGSVGVLAVPAHRGPGPLVPRRPALAVRAFDLRGRGARRLRTALQRHRRLRSPRGSRRSVGRHAGGTRRDRHGHHAAAVGALLPRRHRAIPAARLQGPLRRPAAGAGVPGRGRVLPADRHDRGRTR